MHPYHKNGAEPFWYDEAKGFAGGKWPWAIAVWTEPKPESERVSHRDLTVAALKQAVEMWHSKEKHDKDYLSGDAAYAHWIGWLRDVESGKAKDPKAGMQGNGWCFDVLVHSRRIASRWLREQATQFGDEARPHFLDAADRYAEIVEICLKDLECTWSLALPPKQFDKWTSEMRKDQIARLEAARALDAAAIAAIEKALAAIE